MLLALSFPKFGHPACAWVALAPLLTVAWDCGRQKLLRRAFLLGWAAGCAYFAIALYWLVNVMTMYGGLSTPVAVLVGALLMAYLALFPAISTWIIAAAARELGAQALLLAPAAWVTGELGRTYVWSGFPWVLLGYSQVTVLPIAQTASLVGVYGLSMLLAFTSGAAAYALVRLQSPGLRDRGNSRRGSGPDRRSQSSADRRSRSRSEPSRRHTPVRRRWSFLKPYARAFAPLLVAALLITGLAIWGARRIADGRLTHEGTLIRAGVVQGNIAQNEKWTGELQGTIMRRYIDLSRNALGQGASFVIWPESSLPYYFELSPREVEPIRRLAREGRAAFLIGSDQVEQIRFVPGQPPPEPPRYYNSAFLVTPDGLTGAVYRKMHLVPFGEYVPLKRLLFFVAPLVEAVSDFSPGTEPSTLPVAGHTASTAICYEVVYPRLIAGFVDRGSELLTTITNDAWFGTSSAAYQHWDQASMRAIEQGRYLARAANTGISGFVDPYGRALSRTGLFETAVQVEDLRFLSDRTVYGRIGDSVAYAGLAIAVLMLVLTRGSHGRSVRTNRQNPLE